VFVSLGNKMGFEKLFPQNSTDRRVVYNLIDNISIIEKSREQILDYNRDEDFLFCSIGRLSSEKGYDRLIEAMKVITEKEIKCKCIIIGDGKDYQQLSELIMQYKLDNIIKLLGYKENPYPYLKISDCYICPSRAEGLSTSAIEAVILHTPVLTTECAGMNEILKDGEYGLIVDNSTEGLIEGIENLLCNESVFDTYKTNLFQRDIIYDRSSFLKNFDLLIS
jgi:glycosyltransferase involved in cell wall biosynthesis